WPELDPALGALAGISKTAGREWPRVACKAIDLGDGGLSPDRAAAAIIEELRTRGPSEVGLAREGRIAVETAPKSGNGPPRNRPASLGPDDLVVISGGARGITAEVAVAMGQAFRPRLLLLGRSPAPEEEGAGLAACRDEAELKHHFLAGPDRRSP